MAHDYKMTRALNCVNLIVSIDEVSNGLSCDCSCLACGARLVAKQGGDQAHHFAHSAKDHKTKLCKWSYETDLHIIAKEVIRKTKTLSIPLGSYEPELMVLEFDEVEEEKILVDSRLRPDITASFKGEIIHVEIAVSNICKQEKIVELRLKNLNVIEIYLSEFKSSSDIILFDEVKGFIDHAHKKWLSICPSGYIGSLINEHERTLLRDLMQERSKVESEMCEARSELFEIEETLCRQRPSIEENELYLEGLALKSEAYKNKLRQNTEALRNELNELYTEKELILKHIQFQENKAVTESKELAQQAFVEEKQLLTDEYFEKLKIEHTDLNKNLQITKQSLNQWNTDLEKVISEHLSISNKILAFQQKEKKLYERELDIEQAYSEIQKRERKYQTIAHNLVRISPDLRAITRKIGMPFPFDEGVIKVLEKPVR